MASTFSDLKFELIGSGEQSNTWGNTTNTNIGTAIEQAITGLSNPVFTTDATLTLTLTDLLGPALQVPRALVLNVTSVGNLTATRDMVVPTIEKQYLVHNNTSGGQSIVVKTAAGTGITVPNGAEMHLYVNGVNVIDAVTHFSSLTLGAALPVTSGGTGATTSTGTGSSVLSNSPTLVTPNLGTPSALVGTNITGTASGLTAGTVTTNANLTGMVTSVGNAASLGSFTSANLAAALTDETGSGAAVFATSPTLVTPNLGTPASGTLTNATGLPLSTGVTGTLPVANGGTGLTTATAYGVVFAGTTSTGAFQVPAGPGTATHILTSNGPGALPTFQAPPALGNLTGAVTSVGAATSLGSFTSANLAGALTDETGSGAAVFATSPTLVTPNLGTPASGTLTNTTGLPIDGGTTGILPVARGGSGTATPALVQGSNITITGTWPNQTISAAAPGTGTVTSVGGTGTVNGLTLSGTVTTSGNLTLGGTLSGTASGLTAGNVTTNANLAGAVTSVGNTTSLGSFTSANLAAALTDETGSGANVFATSPTLVTPVLGTPTSGNLDNCTADGTSKVGYRNVPPSGAKTSSYTLVAADVGKFVELGAGGAVVVPAGIFAAGDVISIFNNTSGNISCTCSAVTDVYKAGTDADISSFIIQTRGVATVLFITTTRAVVSGNLV
jgi:hypothetical protein